MRKSKMGTRKSWVGLFNAKRAVQNFFPPYFRLPISNFRFLPVPCNLPLVT